MAERYYPAVLERGPAGAFGIFFPDLPGCVSAGDTMEEAMAGAREALGVHLDGMAEAGEPIPRPSSLDEVEVPEGVDVVALVAVPVAEVDGSERVNVYLPKSLLGRIDQFVGQTGMNRSSFFGLAARRYLQEEQRSDFEAELLGPARAVSEGEDIVGGQWVSYCPSQNVAGSGDDMAAAARELIAGLERPELENVVCAWLTIDKRMSEALLGWRERRHQSAPARARARSG